MLKAFVGMALLVAMCISSNLCFASDRAILKKFIDQNYAQKLSITPQQIIQLSWVMRHTRRTYDMDYLAKDSKMHVEILRALTRLNCLQLLKSGSKIDYDQFVAAQLTGHESRPLNFASFIKLAKYIQNLSEPDYELLQTATILSAVSLSDLAFDKAQHLLNINNSNRDSLQFLASTIRSDSTIYPLIQQFTHDKQAAKKLLYVLFPPQTNFRHMLYTEGGADMFKNLRTMIQHQYIKKEELDMWYAYWIVNIAGFRGHVDQNGSQYLTEPVFESMAKLKSLIDLMLDSPNFNPLVPYLQYRSSLLGFSHMPQDQALVLSHLGAMMRLYTVHEGQQLHAGFTSLNNDQQLIYSAEYLRSISNYSTLTVTHVPAFIANTKHLVHGSLKRTIHVVVPIYNELVIKAKMDRDQGRVHDQQLSFNTLSAGYNIRRILELGVNASIQRLTIDKSGEVLLHK